ncbi:hypothetical protein FOA52_014508 [Chlamydomonas sp. UWO 241]|nr:hypothetical protein FOA52_014508 [Chlamydomonas sp. UWO 241]
MIKKIVRWPSSDIDIFLYGITTEAEANESTVTIVAGNAPGVASKRRIQIVTRLYVSIGQIVKRLDTSAR